jgi:RimJ/RimL family protein N-acetyltransferase
MLPIVTARLLIRPLVLDDAEAVFSYRSDPDITRYQMWRPAGTNHIRQFIRDQTGCIPGMPGMWYQMAIVLQETNELIGDCGVHVSLDDSSSAELGLTLRGEAQRKGYAAEALGALIDYCFSALHMSRINARIFSMNQPALRLVELIGFEYTGRLSSRLEDGSEGEDLFYTLTRSKRFAGIQNPPDNR